MVLKISIAVVLALIAFVIWRYTSVARGARTRDDALLKRLDPLAERFEAKSPVTADEIRELARSPELRPMLHAMIGHYQRPELFPAEHLTDEMQAESTLVYWMLHPNELQAAPAEIALMEALQRELFGEQATFYVFRYTLPRGHWAGADSLVGLAGPFYANEKPYDRVAGGFSRAGDRVGTLTPAVLVDWYVDLLKKRGIGRRA